MAEFMLWIQGKWEVWKRISEIPKYFHYQTAIIGWRVMKIVGKEIQGGKEVSIGLCSCGETISLPDFTNECTCGRLYNWAGQPTAAMRRNVLHSADKGLATALSLLNVQEDI